MVEELRLAPGFERIYAPGEKEEHTREAYRREGLPLDGPTRANLSHAARQVGIATGALRWLGGA